MNYSVEMEALGLLTSRNWAGDAGVVPYRVELDAPPQRKVLCVQIMT